MVRISAIIVFISLSILCTASSPPLPATGLATGSAFRQLEENLYERRYHQIWNLVNDSFLYRERLSNWWQWKHRFDGKLKSDREAKTAVAVMLNSLNDDYTLLKTRKNPESYGKQVAFSRMLPGEIGYLRLQTLEAPVAVEQTRRSLMKLMPAREIIIDFRDNKGGLIESAYAVFSMLSGQDRFGTFKGRCEGREYVEEVALTQHSIKRTLEGIVTESRREPDLLKNRPLVVLVNGNTRSAAEMLAGALQDNRKARLVGSKTYGKGVVQNVWDFVEGSEVKITCAKYYLPSGADIHSVGLMPDIVSNPSGQDGDPTLQVAIAYLTSKLQVAQLGRPVESL